MTDQEILQRLRDAENGTQVAFPNETTKYRAFLLLSLHLPNKQVYITTQEDYDLWLSRPFGNAPTPGS